jgi:hypothetical protein
MKKLKETTKEIEEETSGRKKLKYVKNLERLLSL